MSTLRVEDKLNKDLIDGHKWGDVFRYTFDYYCKCSDCGFLIRLDDRSHREDVSWEYWVPARDNINEIPLSCDIYKMEQALE